MIHWFFTPDGAATEENQKRTDSDSDPNANPDESPQQPLPPSSESLHQSQHSQHSSAGLRSQRSSFTGSASSLAFFDAAMTTDVLPQSPPRHSIAAGSLKEGQLTASPRSHYLIEEEGGGGRETSVAAAVSALTSIIAAASTAETEAAQDGDDDAELDHHVHVDGEEEKEASLRGTTEALLPPRDSLLGKLDVDGAVRLDCLKPKKSLSWKGQFPHELREGDFSNSDHCPDFRLQSIPSTEAGDESMALRQKSINFIYEDRKKMTYSRRLALWLMRYKWYYSPRELEEGGGDPLGSSYQHRISLVEAKLTDAYPYSHSRKEAPSLEKAWAYFEHVALPRYIVEDPDKPASRQSILKRGYRKLFCKADKKLQLAPPGENERTTELYSSIFTPHKQLGEFGLGIGLYFSTLRAMAILAFIAGCINIPNNLYFSSEEYSGGQVDVDWGVRGTAICTDTEWVPCPNCRNSSDSLLPNSRLGVAHNPDNNSFLVFALKNNCDGARLQQGMVNYATIWIIVVGVFFLNRYVNRMQIKMDEGAQTAQDYGIVIDNPPPDATDPNEWKEFFDSTFGTHVTTCTVVVNNDLLIRSLVERREILRKIEMKIEPGTSMDRMTLSSIAAKEEHERSYTSSLWAKIIPGTPELFGRLVVLTSKVQGLAQQNYPPTHVYIIFEKEDDQRRVLDALKCCSKLDRWRNNVKAAGDPSHLFRGTCLLNAEKPEEPTTIRWQDLHTPLRQRSKQQLFAFLVTIVSVALIAFLIRYCNGKSVKLAALTIAATNLAFPWVAKFLTWYMEEHPTSTGVQKSMYLKIALFRWVNTAIVITIITPFTESLTNIGGLIPQIHAIFFAEIVTTNLVQLSDPMGHLRRHFLAPRAKTQDEMNLQCQGTVFELAERYTSMTKTVFLSLWYCAIYPGAWFMCSFTLFVNYVVDRFSLMRTWKMDLGLGTIMSEINRKYFFPLSLVAMALMSSYFWSAFPFDNLCVTNTTVSNAYVGVWKIEQLDAEPQTNTTEFWELDQSETTKTSSTLFTEVDAADTNFQFCLQDFFQFPSGERFPFIPKFQPPGLEWMTDEQETITTIYGWSVVAIILLIAAGISYQIVEAFLRIFLKDTNTSIGCEDQGIDYSDVPSISSYVPQVKSGVFSYPLLACPTEKIREDLLEWNDPDRPFSFYDLTKDAAVLTKGMDVSSKFSRFAHWTPPGKTKTQ